MSCDERQSYIMSTVSYIFCVRFMCFWEGIRLQFMCIFFLPVPEHCDSLMYLVCHLFSHSHFSVWPLFPPSLYVPSLSSCFISHIHSLCRAPPPPPVVQGWVREGGGGGGGLGRPVSGHRAEGGVAACLPRSP